MTSRADLRALAPTRLQCAADGAREDGGMRRTGEEVRGGRVGERGVGGKTPELLKTCS